MYLRYQFCKMNDKVVAVRAYIWSGLVSAISRLKFYRVLMLKISWVVNDFVWVGVGLLTGLGK